MERKKQITRFFTEETFEEIMLNRFAGSENLKVNKSLIAQYGGIGALILSNYVDKHIYFKNKYPDFDGWFCFTFEMQIKELGIQIYTLRKWKKYFVEKQLISEKWIGIPGKLHFKINFKNINFYGKD